MKIDPFSPAVTLLKHLRAGQISARELLDAHLSRVERLNPSINAVITLDAERARLRADAIDASGHDGTLAGLPLTIKDSFETAGLRTTCGAPQWRNHVPAAHAQAVQRLDNAGAVIFGKSNVPIYTTDLQSYNSLFGTTSNPWDRGRSCGGSSGGAAAAVAAGLSAFELGSDIGGSIRIPAHFCGVYGHKPSWRRVPMRGHIPPPPGSVAEPDLAVAGPLARSAEDLDVLLGVLREDAATDLAPPRAIRLRDFRVRAWIEDPAFPLDDDVKGPLEANLEALRRAGVRVQVGPPDGLALAECFDHYLRMLWPLTTAHLSEKALARVQEAARAAGEDSMHARLARYSTISHREWLALDEKRHALRDRLRRFFEDCDILLCPVGPVAAIRHDHSDDLMARAITVNGRARWYWEQMAWISLATLAWLPATAAPAGRGRSGLPVGIQIIGPWKGDRTCVEFARLLAGINGGYQPPPGYA